MMMSKSAVMIVPFNERVDAMNDLTDDLDQAGEDILSYTVSDEALEAAAGTEGDIFYSRATNCQAVPTACCQ
jgi:hypothetical protein